MGAVLAGHGGGGGAGLESVVAATCSRVQPFGDGLCLVVLGCVTLQMGLAFPFVSSRLLLSDRCCGPQLLLFRSPTSIYLPT